jgi:hypothetical protein
MVAPRRPLMTAWFTARGLPRQIADAGAAMDIR